MGSWAERTHGKVAAGRPSEAAVGGVGGPSFAARINLEEQLGSETDLATQGSSVGK